MKGRPSKELSGAIKWLEIRLKRGPVSASEALACNPSSIRTLRKAKKMLKLVVKKKGKAWMWYMPSNDPFSIPGVEPIDKTPAKRLPEPAEPDLEEYDGLRMTTKDMILLVNNLILMGNDTTAIKTEVALSCAAWPMVKPYSKEYINSVVDHAIDGTPIKRELNQNEEQY